jgi:hypothetical protein
MATAVKTKDYELTRKNGYKLKKVTTNNETRYAVLEYKTFLRFFREFKMWKYVRNKENKQVRLFKDLRSAKAYINYMINPAMNKQDSEA